MHEETFNLSIRKFLKKVGITSQRDIEQHVDEAIRQGTLKGNEQLKATIVLEIPDIGVKTEVMGKIELE